MALNAQQTLVLQSAHSGDLGALDALLRLCRPMCGATPSATA